MPGVPGMLDWRPLVRAIISDRRDGVSIGAIAMRFHRALAGGIVSVAEQFPKLPIVLCGGCFCNRVLTELVAEQLAAFGRQVATPGIVPVNDGGLAAGQLAIAAARCNGGWRPCA
jgi:hydrogenase maturation protein HypF